MNQHHQYLNLTLADLDYLAQRGRTLRSQALADAWRRLFTRGAKPAVRLATASANR